MYNCQLAIPETLEQSTMITGQRFGDSNSSHSISEQCNHNTKVPFYHDNKQHVKYINCNMVMWYNSSANRNRGLKKWDQTLTKTQVDMASSFGTYSSVYNYSNLTLSQNGVKMPYNGLTVMLWGKVGGLSSCSRVGIFNLRTVWVIHKMLCDLDI